VNSVIKIVDKDYPKNRSCSIVKIQQIKKRKNLKGCAVFPFHECGKEIDNKCKSEA
jgi:hypothetical protein